MPQLTTDMAHIYCISDRSAEMTIKAQHKREDITIRFKSKQMQGAYFEMSNIMCGCMGGYKGVPLPL